MKTLQKGRRGNEGGRKSFSVQSGLYLHHITQIADSNPSMDSMLPNPVVILSPQLTLTFNKIWHHYQNTFWGLSPQNTVFSQDTTHSWFSSCITGHFFSTSLSSSCTSPWPHNGGMPQGSNLHPLFCLYSLPWLPWC